MIKTTPFEMVFIIRDTMSLKYRVFYDDFPQYHNARNGARLFILPALALILTGLFLSLHHIDFDAVEMFWSEENVGGSMSRNLLRDVYDRGEMLLDSLRVFCKPSFYEG